MVSLIWVISSIDLPVPLEINSKSAIVLTLTIPESLLLSLLISVGIFMVIPTTVGGIFSKIIDNKLILNLIEGILRLSILFAYIVIISKNNDIKRVFQYHGAEHKSIHCYESGLELTIVLHMQENAGNEYQLLSISNFEIGLYGYQWTVGQEGIEIL